jgi:hypothetical protein
MGKGGGGGGVIGIGTEIDSRNIGEVGGFGVPVFLELTYS